jgi:hypothetical protein
MANSGSGKGCLVSKAQNCSLANFNRGSSNSRPMQKIIYKHRETRWGVGSGPARVVGRGARQAGETTKKGRCHETQNLVEDCEVSSVTSTQTGQFILEYLFPQMDSECPSEGNFIILKFDFGWERIPGSWKCIKCRFLKLFGPWLGKMKIGSVS